MCNNILKQAEELANKLIKGYLPGLGYKFAWNNRQRAFGLCNFKKKTIELSRVLTQHQTIEEVKNTILHEIAHAIHPEDGHGPKWRKTFIGFGGDGERVGIGNEEIRAHALKNSKYTLTCPKCGRQSPMHKKPKRQSSCGKCNPRMYDPTLELVLTQNY